MELCTILESYLVYDEEYYDFASEGIVDIAKGIGNFFKNVLRKIIDCIKGIKNLFTRKKNDREEQQQQPVDDNKNPTDKPQSPNTNKKEPSPPPNRPSKGRYDQPNKPSSPQSRNLTPVRTKDVKSSVPANSRNQKMQEYKSRVVIQYINSMERLLSVTTVTLNNETALKDEALAPTVKEAYERLLELEEKEFRGSNMKLPANLEKLESTLIQRLNSTEAAAKKAFNSLEKVDQSNISKQYMNVYSAVLRNVTNLYNIFKRVA